MSRTAAAAAPARHPGPGETMLELQGISKSFPGVKALDDVSMTLRRGEIHMLLGENGAGKSTLMKVLCGAEQADAGRILLDGAEVPIDSAAASKRLGIAVIFQEFSLVPYLDIAQNIFLGREPSGRFGLVDRKRLYSGARRLMELLGLDLDPRTKVHRLAVAQQQMVEIAKALSQDARILVLDEPTAALSDRETEKLFEVMRKLQADGVGMIYISHRIAEVFTMGDRISVLRDGRNAGETLPEQTDPDALVRMMVGRNVDTTYARTAHTPGDVVLELSGVGSSNGIAGIDLTVRAGEIVGLCGLVGSGRTEVARAIFGVDPVTAGEVRLNGEVFRGGPEAATRAGIALIPENRKAEGLALIRSVNDNLMLAGMPQNFPGGIYRPDRARRLSARLVEKLSIVTPSTNQQVSLLSGGNQQKVVIGKWLEAGSRLFIFDEPTRGIDVGAKAEIFGLIDRLCADGAAVLMISSEQIEIVHVCDRAYVMRDGRIVGELSGETLTEENIVRMGMDDG